MFDMIAYLAGLGFCFDFICFFNKEKHNRPKYGHWFWLFDLICCIIVYTTVIERFI